MLSVIVIIHKSICLSSFNVALYITEQSHNQELFALPPGVIDRLK